MAGFEAVPREVWLAAAGALTVLLGLLLFIRKPRVKARAPSRRRGDPDPLQGEAAAAEDERLTSERSPRQAPTDAAPVAEDATIEPTRATGTTTDSPAPATPATEDAVANFGPAAARDARQLAPAGFFHRGAALLLDSFVLWAVFGVVFSTVQTVSGPIAGMTTKELWLLVGLGTLFGWSYKAGMECSPLQATIGKLACGLRVTDTQHRRVTFARASGRALATWLQGFIGGLAVGLARGLVGSTEDLAPWLLCLAMSWGYLLALGRTRRAFHDRIARTLVLRC